MNQFEIYAQAYRRLIERDVFDREEIEKRIRFYEFLSICDETDLCLLIDTSAFNDIIRSYFRMALRNAGVNEELKEKILFELQWIFDDSSAKDVLYFENE